MVAAGILAASAAGILAVASCAFAFIAFYVYSKFRGGDPDFDKARLPPLFWVFFAVAFAFLMFIYPGTQGLADNLRRLIS